MTSLLTAAGVPEAANRLRVVWQEYEQQESHVSKIVHQIDKLDPLQQAFQYTRQHPDQAFLLEDFKAKSILDGITDPFLVDIKDRILSDWDAYESRKRNFQFILVLGGPGVGKGTQCATAAAHHTHHGCAHISVGDLLRQEQADLASPFRQFISNSFAAKVPVPPLLVMKLLIRELESDGTRGKRVILLDGFPRSVPQLEEFEEQVRTYTSYHEGLCLITARLRMSIPLSL